MEFIESKAPDNAAVRKGFAVIAVAEDRALAKDYKNFLLSREIEVDVQRCEGDEDGKFEYYISVDHENIDQSIKLIKMRNPEDYFYDSLFGGEDENEIDEVF